MLLAVGIIGATVMPHAMYLHSGLTQDRMPVRDDNERRRLLRFSNREVLCARHRRPGQHGDGDDGRSAFHAGHAEVAEIETAYHTLTPLLGVGAAAVFLPVADRLRHVGSTVGTMAGQVIMQDFVGFRIPLWLRRLVTMLPAFVVVAMGVNSTEALVISQVVLSLVLPVPMIALIIFAGRRDIMGGFVNGKVTRAAALVGAGVVLMLNMVLIAQAIGLQIPGLSAAG